MKAVGLFSGGLDSALAAKIIQNQGIEVEVLIFCSPFFNTKKEESPSILSAKSNGIKYKVIDLGLEYMNIVKNPKHGYGKYLNPCIDCKILMLKKAKEYMEKSGAEFVFTGEVLGQRPKSQHLAALKAIEEESGMKGKLLRPLSAKLLEETEAEKKGLIDREKLLDIKGRQRKKQIELAKEFRIKDFSSPAGGCCLTEEGYSRKLKDLIEHKKDISLNDLGLLSVGRHFRFEKNKIIVGRNKMENEALVFLMEKTDLKFEAEGIPGPTTILTRKAGKEAIELAAAITSRYSDAPEEDVEVKYGKKELDKKIVVKKISDAQIEKYRIC